MLEFFNAVAPTDLVHLKPKGLMEASSIHSAECLPEIVRGSVLLMGVVDERNPIGYAGGSNVPSFIRRQLYALAAFGQKTNLIDLGDLKVGYSVEDTKASIRIVLEEAVAADCYVILLGGSRSLWAEAYKMLGSVRKNLEIAVVDKMLDLSPEGAYHEMVLTEPNYLFNLSALAVQSHHVWIESREVFKKLGFDILTLGALRANIYEAEAMLRNSDIFLVDFSGIAYAYAPGTQMPGPNGLTGEDICRLARFSGAGNNCRFFWLSELDFSRDRDEITAQLAAQAIWYFVEGLANRRNEIPSKSNAAFSRYHVALNEGKHELVFYKSNETSRWWVEIPHPRSAAENRLPIIFPCTLADYQLALRNEVPDRWWRTAEKYA